MKISKAEYILLDGRPFLRVVIDGKEAIIGNIKWSVLQLGYVPLTSRDPAVDWDQILPKASLPETEKENAVDLTGFTDNINIVKLATKYWNAINSLNGEKFVEGPVNF
jgi:hypothetical protein